MKKLYEDYRYDEVFDKLFELLPMETREDKFEELRMHSRYTYVIKTTTSGNMVESEIYPTYKCRQDIPRSKERKESNEFQKKLNHENSKKKVVRIVNTNFVKGDLFITVGYADGYLPAEEEARKDIQNYIRRIKRYRNKNGMSELKYICSIGYEDDPNSKKVRIHHHIIMNYMDRDVAEELWGKGRANSKRLQPDDFELEGVAKYIAQQSKIRWSYSKNLKKPTVTKNRTRLTKTKVEKIFAKNINDFKNIFEELYSECNYKDGKVFYSDIVAGYYIYTKLRKKDVKKE